MKTSSAVAQGLAMIAALALSQRAGSQALPGHGPDGKVQKTPIGDPPPPPQKKRGLRGKVIEKKKEEMKEDLQAATALVHQYVPPDPGLMQVVMNAGKASMAQQGPGAVALKFSDYLKGGDALTLTFDTAVKAMRQISVSSYMDDPSS
jgi:hypothetical protein